jgi:hypothetical protein
MRTLNQTPGNDNEIVWIYILEMDSGTKKYASEDITLSGNAYDGSVISRNSIKAISKMVNISQGGGLGSIGNSQFSIPRDNTDSLTQDFINSFFPSTGEELITSRYFTIGIVWSGATYETEITYLQSFYIENQGSSYYLMDYPLAETAELDTIQLPPYKIQKDDDDGISYFPKATDDVLGQAMYIYYGDYSLYTSYIERRTNQMKGYAEAVSIDDTNAIFNVCCHECKSIWDNDTNNNMNMLKYISGIEYYMIISYSDTSSGATSYTNNFFGHTITMLANAYVGELLGDLVFQLKEFYPNQVVNTNVDNIVDADETNYTAIGSSAGATLLGNRVGLKPNATTNNSEVGYPQLGAPNAKIQMLVESADASSLEVSVLKQDPAGSGVGSQGHVITTQSIISYDFNATSGEPDSIDQIFRSYYELLVADLYSPERFANVYNIWLELTDITIYGLTKSVRKYKLRGIPPGLDTGRDGAGIPNGFTLR